MFFALELLHLAVVGMSALMGVSMYPTQMYTHLTELESSQPIAMVREGYRSDGRGKCVFNGTMVPFEQDYEITQEEGGQRVVIPPRPGSIAGMALILHTKQCGQNKTHVARWGYQSTQLVSILTTSQHDMYDYDASKPDSLPQWLPQVRERLERLAMHDANALDALVALNRAAAGLPEGDPVIDEGLSRTVLSRELYSTLDNELGASIENVSWTPAVVISSANRHAAQR